MTWRERSALMRLGSSRRLHAITAMRKPASTRSSVAARVILIGSTGTQATNPIPACARSGRDHSTRSRCGPQILPGAQVYVRTVTRRCLLATASQLMVSMHVATTPARSSGAPTRALEQPLGLRSSSVGAPQCMLPAGLEMARLENGLAWETGQHFMMQEVLHAPTPPTLYAGIPG